MRLSLVDVNATWAEVVLFCPPSSQSDGQTARLTVLVVRDERICGLRSTRTHMFANISLLYEIDGGITTILVQVIGVTLEKNGVPSLPFPILFFNVLCFSIYGTLLGSLFRNL